MRIRHYPLLFALAFFLSACGVSLAEDVPPPADFVPTAASQPETSNTLVPVVPPDPARGAPIYAEACLPCHGASGLGDGPQSADLPDSVAPIGSSAVARQASPVNWYHVFTEGNIAHSMPGFASNLDNRQRWDVLAYIYTLAMDDQMVMMGQALYTEYCAECHGEKGQDGTENISDWSDPALLANLSGEQINAALSSNMGGEMPSFDETFNDTQRWAVVDYVRTLGFASAPPMESGSAAQTPADTPEPEAEPQESGESPSTQPESLGLITVSGLVAAIGSEELPVEDLTIALQGFEGMTQALAIEGQLADDGTFSFEDIDAVGATVFLVVVESEFAGFMSEPIHAADFENSLYEGVVVEWIPANPDPSLLDVPRLHVFFDFSIPGLVQVVQLYIISNPTDALIVPPDPETPLMHFELPEGAANLQFDDSAMGDKVFLMEGGFGLSDGIEPFGQRQFLYAYDLPYEPESGLFKEYRQEVIFNLPVPVDEALIMVPAAGVQAEADWLVAAGTQDMQGMAVQLYSSAGLPQGQTSLELIGQPSAGGAAAPQSGNKMTGILIGAAVLGLALIGGGLWFYRMQQAEDEIDDENSLDEDDDVFESEDEVLDAILALEDQFEAGELPDDVYQRRRAALKARLRQLRDSEDSEDDPAGN
jgi:mono/diheme cytochrome c family protein